MVDLLESASAWLDQMRLKHCSRTVTYQRGAASVDIPATVGSTTYEIDDGYGVVEAWESRDYLIPTESLVLNEQQTLPQRGDRIRETAGTRVFLYEVMAPGKEPHFVYSDPYRRTLRIHTKHVERLDV